MVLVEAWKHYTKKAFPLSMVIQLFRQHLFRAEQLFHFQKENR